MKKVLTYGTFDCFHYGHLNLLKRAVKLGDHLTVGLSTDSFNLIKNKTSIHSYKERKENLEQLKIIDLIIPEENWEQKFQDIRKHNINILVMGDDWKGNFDFLENDNCKVIYLKRTKIISTTLIKNLL